MNQKSIIVYESSTEESESKRVQKSVYKEKDSKNDAEHEEHTVTYYPFFKEHIYFNILEFGKNILNNLGAMWEPACIVTPKDKYCT